MTQKSVSDCSKATSRFGVKNPRENPSELFSYYRQIRPQGWGGGMGSNSNVQLRQTVFLSPATDQHTHPIKDILSHR